MDIKMSLALPGEALSIPVIRRVLGDTLRTLGVADECLSDIQLAVSEACTNVLDHAGPEESYEVVAAIEDTCCVLKVVDRGVGFDVDVDVTATGPIRADAERGRGIQIMRALVDNVSFDSRPEQGTVVYLQKQLEWRDKAPVGKLGAAGLAG